MSERLAPARFPSEGGLAGIRTLRQLHQHFFDRILRWLEKTWPDSTDSESWGLGILAVDREAFSASEAKVAPRLLESGWEALSVNARCWKTRNPIRVMLFGWLRKEDYLQGREECVNGIEGWVSKAALFGPKGSLIFFECLGIALSEPVTVDLFDHLPDRSIYRHSPSRHGSEDWMFDYSSRTADLSGLCYTRCRWGIDEQRGMVLEREPGTCGESHHNALLQASAPMMYETLRELARESPSAHPLVLAALSTVEDPEWETAVSEELRSGAPGVAETAMRLACGHGTTRMDWRAFLRDYLRDETLPQGPMGLHAYRWLLSGYVEGAYVTGEALFVSPSRIQVRVLHPCRGFSMEFESAFHPASDCEFLDLPDRLSVESGLAGLFLLSRWIDRNWTLLQLRLEDYRRELRSLRTPPFHEPKAHRTWRTHLEKRLAIGKIARSRFEQEIGWVLAENAAHTARLKELKQAFFDSLSYPDPPRPIRDVNGVLVEPPQWGLPRLTEALQERVLACLEADRPQRSI